MGTRIKTVDADTRSTVASAGGKARAQNLTPAERSEIARAGAARTNSPLGLSERIRRHWPSLTRAERRQVAEVLRGCNGLVGLLMPQAPAAVARRKRTADTPPVAS